MKSFSVSANFIDVFQRKIYPVIASIENGKIKSIEETEEKVSGYLLPGFIDAHIHIESSMLVPTAFAKLATLHGTVATISDPHEIANVCGMAGVQYMIDNAKQTPFKFFFGAPSCVPATRFETAGATLDARNVAELLQSADIWYLSEVMNYPGVLQDDAEVMAKIEAAKKSVKPVDGHAPGLRGASVKKYASAGITTDHESFTYEEATEKLNAGIKCLIREGSAAKNFEALIDVLKTYPDQTMFCSDDKHPDELILHHINDHVKRALKKGFDLFDILRAACINPVLHYNIPVGLLRKNDPADFIIIDNLQDFNILQTYIDGERIAEKGRSLLPDIPVVPINNFCATHYTSDEFKVKTAKEHITLNVIEAIEGQLITRKIPAKAKISENLIVSDTENDVLKIAIVNRYVTHAAPAVSFIKNFGIKKGAIASTVAHDCHNIIVVGVDDESIAAATNALVDAKGGIAVAENKTEVQCMSLPIAGLMSDKDGIAVAKEYSEMDKAAKALGCTLQAPFMTLSFMALLVIPELKLSDKGLFDGNRFEFIPLTEES